MDAVQQIKERLSIVDVVSAYVKLTRAGKYWKGLSPFTKEKTPSFFVSPDKGLYHCFSTGKGGDMFTFIQELEGVDFRGALTMLAEKAGVEIVKESKETRDAREELFAAVEAAAAYFVSVLHTRSDVREYLRGRGLSESTTAEWRIGYAPSEWRSLKQHLNEKGFSERTLIDAGLIKRPDSGSNESYDRFRGRIIFPIFDVSGRVIAFSGRTFEGKPDEAKYLNSPDSALFDKSRALYGIHVAKNATRNLGFMMLVEGQVDLLLAHQIGFKSTVATSGTAFTLSHAEVLKRYGENVLLSYDGDRAGVNATHRAALTLLPLRMNVKVAELPPDADPADVIRTDPELFKSAVKHAQPVVGFFLSYVARTFPDERQRIAEITRVVLPLVKRIGNALEQGVMIRTVAEALGVSEERVLIELSRVTDEPAVAPEEKSPDPFFSEDAFSELLYGILRTFEDAGDERSLLVERIFVDTFGVESLASMRERGEEFDEVARMRASENFFLLHQTREVEDRAIQEFVREAALRLPQERDEYVRLTAALKRAEAAGDREHAEAILADLTALSKKFK